MSRAFTREDDFVEVVPDRPVSSHPNYVTKRGLAQIEQELAAAQCAYGQAQAAGDRQALARAARDLRYWNARRMTARLVEPDIASDKVQFGGTVTLQRDGRLMHTYRIVGEDEADPLRGAISYVSPLAKAVLGKVVGDIVRAGTRDAEITVVSTDRDRD